MTKLNIEDVDFSGWTVESTALVQKLVDRILEVRITGMRLPDVVVVDFLRDDRSSAIADIYQPGVIVFNTAPQHGLGSWADIDARLRTLSHELVHIEQLHTGKMVFDTTRHKIGWKGHWYDACSDTSAKYQDDVDSEHEAYRRYMQLPWEMEAHAKQERIFNRVFCN